MPKASRLPIHQPFMQTSPSLTWLLSSSSSTRTQSQTWQDRWRLLTGQINCRPMHHTRRIRKFRRRRSKRRSVMVMEMERGVIDVLEDRGAASHQVCTSRRSRARMAVAPTPTTMMKMNRFSKKMTCSSLLVSSSSLLHASTTARSREKDHLCKSEIAAHQRILGKHRWTIFCSWWKCRRVIITSSRIWVASTISTRTSWNLSFVTYFRNSKIDIPDS